MESDDLKLSTEGAVGSTPLEIREFACAQIIDLGYRCGFGSIDHIFWYENTRFNALQLCMKLGADHIDIELKAAHEFNKYLNGDKPEKCKVIVSSHNYDITPSSEELGNLVARIQAAGADIVKFATTTTVDITDIARVFQITVHCQVPIIAMVMGERGLMSRILCPKFGGYLTFGTLEAGKVSAPGQPTIEQLLNLYNFRLIDSDTKVFGIIGKPVSHSKSPKLYNRAFREDGFNGVFLHLLVDDLPKYIFLPGFFCCTIHHKEVALSRCDEVDPVAKLFGCNTDYIGAISAIEDGLRENGASGPVSPLAGKLFVVIGAGGAGKALAYGAKEKGARVVIANRTYERAKELADIIGGQALSLADLESFHPESGMILANTTSIGIQPRIEETPVPKEALKHYELVFDAVYTPKITRQVSKCSLDRRTNNTKGSPVCQLQSNYLRKSWEIIDKRKLPSIPPLQGFSLHGIDFGISYSTRGLFQIFLPHVM
ncbi:hypothetical protein ABFX02_14G012000 [Erythranthe guttata]